MSLASGVQLPSMVPSTDITGASSQALGSIGNQQSTYAGLGQSVLPQAQQTASNLYSNPYAATAQTGANAAAGLGTNAAYSGYNTGAGLVGAGNSLIPYAQQIMTAGFDPQNALYNQQYAQNQQQATVNNAQAGVATSPYGAGVVDQSGQLFNMNWENQQLSRETQAASAAGSLVNTGASVDQTGVNMMNQAPSQLVQSATIPYSTYSDIGTGQNQALSQLLGIGTSGESLSNTNISDLLSYITGQTGVQSTANQTAQVGLNQSQLAFNQLGTLLGGGAGLAGLGLAAFL
jgi:hypothetical protein